MKILLINPPRFNGHTVVREMRCASLSMVSVFPPIELAYLAGVLRVGAEVKIFDANALNKSFDDIEAEIEQFKPEAVVSTVSPTTFEADAQIAKIAKKINGAIKTILLDSHIVPVMPDKIKENFPEIDHLVGILPLVNIPNLLGLPGAAGLENHPLPAYDLLPLGKYSSLSFARRKPFATLVTSVGCSNRCKFCVVGGATVERGYGKFWQFKSPEKILSEMKYLMSLGVKSLYFFDETFTVDKERVKKLCQLIIGNGLKMDWACNGRVDTLNEEMIKLMRKAGCWNIMFGIECGSEGLLQEANKGTTLSKAVEIIRHCKKNGIMVTASFVIGFPHETWQTVRQMLKIAKKINPQRAQFVILTPYPGTQLYEEIKEKGLLERDYSFSGYDAYCLGQEPVVRTQSMSPRELLQAQRYVYRRFYLRPSFWLQTIFSVKSFNQLSDIFKFIKYLR